MARLFPHEERRSLSTILSNVDYSNSNNTFHLLFHNIIIIPFSAILSDIFRPIDNCKLICNCLSIFHREEDMLIALRFSIQKV